MDNWMTLLIGSSLSASMLVWTPMALYLGAPHWREASENSKRTTFLKACLAFGVVGTLSLLFQTGSLPANCLAGCWLAFTFVVGCLGMMRLAYFGFVRSDEVMICFAMLCLPVGGIWYFASRFGYPLFGFSEPLVALTAEHFYYTGLATTLCIGLMGRLVSHGQPRVRRLYDWICIGVFLGIPLVAVGINGHPVIEEIGVIDLSLSLIVLAGMMFWLSRHPKIPKTSSALLLVSPVCIILSMACAIVYRFHLAEFGIPQMLATHGLINAFLFVPSFVMSMFFAKTESSISDLNRPFSRLRSQGPVGPKFFEDIGAVNLDVTAPTGLIDDLTSFARPDLRVELIHPTVRAFYERTLEHELAVQAEWSPLFGAPWRHIVEPLFHTWRQLALPSESIDIDSQIVPVSSKLDQRESVRGWIRVNHATQCVIYVAAYSQHRYRDETFMNIAFPLPGCNLSSILRFDELSRQDESQVDVVLSTFPRTEFASDEGVYLVFPSGALRLPMDETISVFGGTPLRASHRIWFLGLPFLTLNYTINRITNNRDDCLPGV